MSRFRSIFAKHVIISLLVGILIGISVSILFVVKLNTEVVKRRSFSEDANTWLAYIEYLSLAEELTKDRADIDLEISKKCLSRRLQWSLGAARHSKRQPAEVVPLWREQQNPIWDEHLRIMERAIEALENGGKFTKLTQP